MHVKLEFPRFSATPEVITSCVTFNYSPKTLLVGIGITSPSPPPSPSFLSLQAQYINNTSQL